jgi:hypothetical protein
MDDFASMRLTLRHCILCREGRCYSDLKNHRRQGSAHPPESNVVYDPTETIHSTKAVGKRQHHYMCVSLYEDAVQYLWYFKSKEYMLCGVQRTAFELLRLERPHPIYSLYIANSELYLIAALNCT